MTAIVPRSGRALALILVSFLGMLSACDPSCQRVCRKLVEDCDEVETPRLGPEDCEAQCNNQEALYQRWTDEQLQDRFEAYKVCVMSEECEDIADGVCYDDTLYAF